MMIPSKNIDKLFIEDGEVDELPKRTRKTTRKRATKTED